MGLPAGGVRVLALGAGGWPFRGTSRGRVVGRRRRGIATANDDEDETEPDERMALSRLQSSLWPARHAARWQASLQYFRRWHPEQKRSRWALATAMPHWSHVAVWFMLKAG